MKTMSERLKILNSLDLFPAVLSQIICGYLRYYDLELAKKIYAKLLPEEFKEINWFSQYDMHRMYQILFLCVQALAYEQPFDCEAGANILKNMDQKPNKKLNPDPMKMLERVLIREFTMAHSDSSKCEANLVDYKPNFLINKPSGFDDNIDLCLILIGFRLVMIHKPVINSIEQQNESEGYTPASKWLDRHSESLQFFLRKHSPKTRAIMYDKVHNTCYFALFPSEAKLLKSTSEKVHFSELKSSIEEVLKGYSRLLPQYNQAPGLLSDLSPTISQPVRIINELLERVENCSSFQAIKSLFKENKFKAIDQRYFKTIKDLIKGYPYKPMWSDLTEKTKKSLLK